MESLTAATPSLGSSLVLSLADLNMPEQFGFAQRQVITLFCMPSANQDALLAQQAGLSPNELFKETVNFGLLKEIPDAPLVLYFRSVSGTIASGWRPNSYVPL
ncbi:hypothetical protein MYCTH_2127665 [Thermothelomyces thermophilus ATCC 42464]|uniref:Uncharacterized protein n=1 Tax=Thermothelomyces thermophilus (strain ATCC 42464 / BCRC 31852 / DSM 1799) TaxID=573729 RepID=G2QGQ6_THET4|nr:uncharacterized protein MYCTH_2127665 [Thermothelomyces thermophilus ATCC 42464]AEO58618.1 hypothetical protein MYCTH_2127665 [Thermothelomyces thermophilus ATCC 42464]